MLAVPNGCLDVPVSVLVDDIVVILLQSLWIGPVRIEPSRFARGCLSRPLLNLPNDLFHALFAVHALDEVLVTDQCVVLHIRSDLVEKVGDFVGAQIENAVVRFRAPVVFEFVDGVLVRVAPFHTGHYLLVGKVFLTDWSGLVFQLSVLVCDFFGCPLFRDEIG